MVDAEAGGPVGIDCRSGLSGHFRSVDKEPHLAGADLDAELVRGATVGAKRVDCVVPGPRHHVRRAVAHPLLDRELTVLADDEVGVGVVVRREVGAAEEEAVGIRMIGGFRLSERRADGVVAAVRVTAPPKDAGATPRVGMHALSHGHEAEHLADVAAAVFSDFPPLGGHAAGLGL